RARRKATSFSMMIAQAQIEASNSPNMTTLTTGWAVMKSSRKEKPPEESLTSGGFIRFLSKHVSSKTRCRRSRCLGNVGGTGAQAPGGQAPGAQAPGAQAPGAQAPGAQAPGAQAEGAQTQGRGAREAAAQAPRCECLPVLAPPHERPYCQAMRRDQGAKRQP